MRRMVLRQTTADDRGPADFVDRQTPHPFDRQHGTDTGGYLPGDTLHSGLAAADFCNTAYYAISPSTLRAALLQLPESPERFTFVDLGCGKGRALLIAAMVGFEQVFGVELSSTLCHIARRNLEGVANAQVIEGDASTLAYPDGALVVFLYHPFLAPLLRRVLRNLQRQLVAAPRTCYLLYANPTYDTVVEAHGAVPVWSTMFPLAAEDAAADRHGTTAERYSLWRIVV